MNENNKSKLIAYFLGAIQAFIGITAIAGGLRLVLNPNGLPTNKLLGIEVESAPNKLSA